MLKLCAKGVGLSLVLFVAVAHGAASSFSSECSKIRSLQDLCTRVIVRDALYKPAREQANEPFNQLFDLTNPVKAGIVINILNEALINRIGWQAPKDLEGNFGLHAVLRNIPRDHLGRARIGINSIGWNEFQVSYSLTEQKRITLQGHTGAVTDVYFNADGTRIITQSVDNTTRIWDAQEPYACLRVIQGAYASSLSFDEKRWACFSHDSDLRGARSSLRVVDAGTEETVTHFRQAPPLDTRALKWSPDGIMLMSSNGHDFQIWNTALGICCHRVDFPFGAAPSMFFSKDECGLLSCHRVPLNDQYAAHRYVIQWQRHDNYLDALNRLYELDKNHCERAQRDPDQASSLSIPFLLKAVKKDLRKLRPHHVQPQDAACYVALCRKFPYFDNRALFLTEAHLAASRMQRRNWWLKFSLAAFGAGGIAALLWEYRTSVGAVLKWTNEFISKEIIGTFDTTNTRIQARGIIACMQDIKEQRF